MKDCSMCRFGTYCNPFDFVENIKSPFAKPYLTLKEAEFDK